MMNYSNFRESKLDSVVVAKAIRYSARSQGLYVNMTQIHKLLYITYGSLLVEKKIRLTEEHSSAWTYGPVFPKVHKNIKLSDNIEPNSYNEIKASDEYIANLIDSVVKKFGRLTAGQLSAWSHLKNSPWDLAVESSNGKWDTKIDDEDIYNYFYSFLNQQQIE